MIEITGEVATKAEVKKGVVGRVAERVGKFLTETYTIKGASAKELKKYEDVYNRFTGDKRAEMLKYYEGVARKSATWKVVRNWVATGAGLALAGTAALYGTAFLGAVKAGNVAGWWALETAGFKNALACSTFLRDKIVNVWNWFIRPARFG